MNKTKKTLSVTEETDEIVDFRDGIVADQSFAHNAILTKSNNLPTVMRMIREGKSSFQISDWLLDNDSDISELYADREVEVARKSLSSAIRLYRSKILSDIDRFPNFNLSGYLAKINGKVDEVNVMQATISYMMSRMDKWAELDARSPMPLRESRADSVVLGMLLEKCLKMKQSLGFKEEVPQKVYVENQDSEIMKNLVRVADAVGEEYGKKYKKEFVRRLAGVPRLIRD